VRLRSEGITAGCGGGVRIARSVTGRLHFNCTFTKCHGLLDKLDQLDRTTTRLMVVGIVLSVIIGVAGIVVPLMMTPNPRVQRTRRSRTRQ
jgi:hypothetical protein